jgi:hypothetical protein
MAGRFKDDYSEFAKGAVALNVDLRGAIEPPPARRSRTPSR